MKTRYILTLLAGLVAMPTQAQTLLDPKLKISAYLGGFSQPTQMRFIGDKDVFVTEKGSGRVIRSRNGVKSTVLDLKVANNSERGLLGLALDPNFARNKFVYTYYSASAGADGGAWSENRLSRFTFNGTALVNEQVLKVFGTATEGLATGPNHDGGPIRFGPDGKLYGVTGDLNRNGAEQNNRGNTSSSHVGGIYRLNADGTIPTDNPFVGNANADFHGWYAYGVRNSYGMAFDPITGNLWDTENGPNVYDEINLVQSGMNSGWNQVMGPGSRNVAGLGRLVNLPNSTYVDPKFSFLSPIGITAIEFTANTRLGASYQDAVIVGDNNTQNLYLLRLNAARNGFTLSSGLTDLVADNVAERNSLLFGQSFGVVTDIQVGADKAIYVTSLTRGAIYRIAAVAPEPGSMIFVAGGVFLCCVLRKERKK